jgi:hypothetical protein
VVEPLQIRRQAQAKWISKKKDRLPSSSAIIAYNHHHVSTKNIQHSVTTRFQFGEPDGPINCAIPPRLPDDGAPTPGRPGVNIRALEITVSAARPAARPVIPTPALMLAAYAPHHSR